MIKGIAIAFGFLLILGFIWLAWQVHKAVPEETYVQWVKEKEKNKNE